MFFSNVRVTQRACPLFSKVNKCLKCKNNYQPSRNIKSENLNIVQGSEKSKKPTEDDPFPDLPPLYGLDDPNYSKHLLRLVANPFLLRYSAVNLSEECKKYYEMKKEEFHNSLNIHDKRNHIDMLFAFNKEEDVEKFLITSDSTNETGRSHGTLVYTQDKTALFSGHLDTEPIQSGKTKTAGFVTMMGPRKKVGFRIKGCYDWTQYTHLVIKVRGDGRTYLINLPCPQIYDEIQGIMYSCPLFTRGGPYWQIAKMPFNHFMVLNKGKLIDKQNTPVHLDAIGNFGITAAGYDGAFKLEIDYVGLEYDEYHNTNPVYEEYYL